MIDMMKEWEMFKDESYFDMYAVRQKGETDFNSKMLFHMLDCTQAHILCFKLNEYVAEIEVLKEELNNRRGKFELPI